MNGITNSRSTVIGMILVVALLALSTVFVGAVKVEAADWDSYDWGGGGDWDYGSYDIGDYDYGSYDYGDYDYGSYDLGDYDYGSYDIGDYDYGSYDLGDYDYGSYDLADYDYGSYDLADYDYGSYDLDDSYDYYDYDDYTEYEEIYEEYFSEESYAYQQMPSYAQQQYKQAMSYLPPQFTPQYPSYPPVYPQPPRPQPPVPQPPVVIPPPVTNTNTNINTCTGNSCNNTNFNYTDNSFVDNSINGSFNTATLTYPQPQPIVQYTYPTYYPQYPSTQAPYCVITITQGSNGMVYLSWSSQYASSAYITPSVGQVAPNGSTSLYAYSNAVYTLTVYGQGGTYVCRTQSFVNPVAPVNPYVSLTQIPYTGLDLGPVGQAIYWASLLSLAVAGAYLLVHYKGGILALATSMKRSQEVTEPEVSTPVEAPAKFAALPTQSNTRDAIRMTRDENGMPRLVIARS